MVCMANDFVSMVLSVGITMFLCAPVYMLMVSRIGKRFVTLIYMTILGVIFLLMGNWFLLPYYVLVGILCEAILWKEGSCQKPKRLTAAWTAASLLYNGVNLLPIWFFWDTYYDFALASGMEQSYIDSYVRYYTSPGWLAFILLFTTLMGFLGLHGGQSADSAGIFRGRRSMRADASFAVPVKLWALLCVFAGVTIGGNVLLTCILTGGALLYLVLQRSFRLARVLWLLLSAAGAAAGAVPLYPVRPEADAAQSAEKPEGGESGLRICAGDGAEPPHHRTLGKETYMETGTMARWGEATGP